MQLRMEKSSLIIVLPTYNNTSKEDSGDYSLAIQLTNQFHNELVNDLIPAVESKYSTYTENVTKEGLEASRDHRGFGGFSMGSVNTWNTFRYCMDYFRYFMPMSGSYSTDGQYMADLVRQQGYGSDDFFIFGLLLEQVILHIMHLKLKSWQWRRIQMECLSSRIMRQTAIFPFWREKVMNIIRWRVMSTRIMDYDFSGMHSEIKIQEEKGDDLC